MTKSAFLFVYDLKGFQTNCFLKIKPDQTSGETLTVSAILKVEVPAFIIYAAFTESLQNMKQANFDKNATCMKGITSIFQVSFFVRFYAFLRFRG